MAYPSDIEIAQSTTMHPIADIAAGLNIDEAYVEQYGRYKAKIDYNLLSDLKDKPDGKLILVTAISPTPAGEGKTTTTVGLADGLRRIGKRAVVALREPSLGPVFGMKGCAAGGWCSIRIQHASWARRWRAIRSAPSSSPRRQAFARRWTWWPRAVCRKKGLWGRKPCRWPTFWTTVLAWLTLGARWRRWLRAANKTLLASLLCLVVLLVLPTTQRLARTASLSFVSRS